MDASEDKNAGEILQTVLSMQKIEDVQVCIINYTSVMVRDCKKM